MSRASPAVPLYEIKGATLSIGGRAIVVATNITLQPARIYGLVGANGSGKSSLIKMLARQQQPSAGSIRLMGKELTDFSDREFARHVAYMPQFTPPAESLTVAELVALGRFPWHGTLGRFSAVDAGKVDEALAQTGLGAFSGRLVDSLSGGERQRVWLAMMLAQDTRCLLLDEPTSALDVAHQVEILTLIRTLSRERAIGVLIVLHDINMAARYCDEIIALRSGRVVAQGAPERIFKGDVLAEIYGLAMGILPHPATGGPISYVL